MVVPAPQIKGPAAFLFFFYHYELNIFQFWSVDQTKQAISNFPLIVISIFPDILQSIQLIDKT